MVDAPNCTCGIATVSTPGFTHEDTCPLAHFQPNETEVPEDLVQPLEELGNLMLSPSQPIYGFSQVHERVFVTWFESRNTEDEFLFVADPMAIELTAEEAKDFNDLFMQQMDQMQALLEGFVQNRKDAFAMDDGAGLHGEETAGST